MLGLPLQHQVAEQTDIALTDLPEADAQPRSRTASSSPRRPGRRRRPWSSGCCAAACSTPCPTPAPAAPSAALVPPAPTRSSPPTDPRAGRRPPTRARPPPERRHHARCPTVAPEPGLDLPAGELMAVTGRPVRGPDGGPPRPLRAAHRPRHRAGAAGVRRGAGHRRAGAGRGQPGAGAHPRAALRRRGLPGPVHRRALRGAPVRAVRRPADPALRGAAQRAGPGDDPPARPGRGGPGRGAGPGGAHRADPAGRSPGRRSGWRCSSPCSWLVRDHRMLARYAYTAGFAGLVLLALPGLLPSSISEVNGAQIWLRLGIFSIQPGEFAKILLIVFFAAFLVQKRELFTTAGRRFLGMELPARPRPGAAAGRLGPVGRRAGARARPRHLAAVLRHRAGAALRGHRAVSWLVIGLTFFVGGGLGGLPAVRPRAHAGWQIWLDPFADFDGAGLPDRAGAVRAGHRRGRRHRAGRRPPGPGALRRERLHALLARRGAGAGRAGRDPGRLPGADHPRAAQRAGRARQLRQAARHRAGVHAGPAGVRRHRRGHQADPADRPDAAVPVLRRLVAGGQLRAGRAAAADLATPPAPRCRAGRPHRRPPIAEAGTELVERPS